MLMYKHDTAPTTRPTTRRRLSAYLQRVVGLRGDAPGQKCSCNEGCRRISDLLTGFIRKTMAVGLWESNYRLRFRSARRELDLTETVERGLVSKSESVSALPPDFSSGSNCQTQSDSLHSQASTVA